tara:strand:- start:256 stop:435 length:180 start_codon:yes stop_codon:yes gene_type:complete
MTKKLSEKLKYWRAERPDEWTMDEFIRDAAKLEIKMESYKMRMNELSDQTDRLMDGYRD